MALKNPWVSYIDRSYLNIKNSVLTKLGNKTPEMTDHSESNIMVVIVSMFAGMAEMLNYYIDNNARESFMPTARRYSSVVKHARLIDYRIKATVPASTDIMLTFLDENGDSAMLDNEIVIPMGTIFNTPNNIVFINTKEITIPVGSRSAIIPVEQKQRVDQALLGNTEGTIEQTLSLGDRYVEGSIFLTLDGNPWENVDTLGRSNSTDKHYIVDISVDKIAYVKFGDDINGAIPTANQQVVADYYESNGEEGNVDANNIDNSDFDFTQFTNLEVVITNPNKAVGGSNYEGLEKIKRSAPLSLRTLDRAVTRADYEDIARLAPGVDKSRVVYDCGKLINIYISPNGGGIAQTTLLNSTKDYIDKRKMVTTFVNVLPTGESEIMINLTAKTRFRRDPIVTKQNIIDELTDKYSYDNSTINGDIRLSDIISAVDNLEKVDYVNLDNLYLKPYLRPINNTLQILVDSITISDKLNTPIKYELEMMANAFRVSRDGGSVAIIGFNQYETINQELNGEFVDVFTIYIPFQTFPTGHKWEFTIYPKNRNIFLDDSTVPVIKEENLNVTVLENISEN